MGIQKCIMLFPFYLCMFKIFHNKTFKINQINLKTNKPQLSLQFFSPTFKHMLKSILNKLLKTTSFSSCFSLSLNLFKAKYHHQSSAYSNYFSTPLLPVFSQSRLHIGGEGLLRLSILYIVYKVYILPSQVKNSTQEYSFTWPSSRLGLNKWEKGYTSKLLSPAQVNLLSSKHVYIQPPHGLCGSRILTKFS